MHTPESVSARLVKFPTISSALPALVFLLFTLMAPMAFAQVIINEVDADQVGTDAAEFIELYDGGAGNTDLSHSHGHATFSGGGHTIMRKGKVYRLYVLAAGIQASGTSDRATFQLLAEN